MKSIKKILKKKGYTAVKLKKIQMPDAGSFHYVLKVEINGKKGNFILDTGASTTVIDMKKAKKFQIEFMQDASGIQAFGASPEQLQIEYSPKNKIEIKQWKGGHFPVILMDLSHVNGMIEALGIKIHGILGADVLNAGQAVVDYGKSRLYLKRKT